MRVLFLGRSEFLFNTIKNISSLCEVVGIITAKSSAECLLDENSYRQLADELKVPYFLKSSIDSEIFEFCKEQKPDMVFSVNWVSLINNSFVELFPWGIFNAHCGRLPNFKGNAIPNWSILLDEKEVVVNIHSMIGGVLDSGKIYKQSAIALHPQTTIKDINSGLAKIVPDLFKELLLDLKAGKLTLLHDCTGEDGFRCYPRLPSYSKISWKDSAQHIHNLIRASTKPYSAYFFYEFEAKLRKTYITAAEVVAHKNSDIAMPGHVLLNNSKNGYSYVQTGEGVIALKSCVHDDDINNEFKPGERWKSIRMNLSISLEDYIYKFFGKIND